jgi:glycosyltransferase involved in cell wall biosynthesis
MPEVDGIPEEMVEDCNKMGEVWVPSQWAKDVFVSSGVKPDKVVVVPEGVNTTKFDPARWVRLPLRASVPPRGAFLVGL